MKKAYIAIIHDIFMAVLSLILAFYLRLGDDTYLSYDFLILAIPLFAVISAFVFYIMRLYRGIWRYASTQDLLAIIKAVSLSVIILVIVMFIINRLEGMPRSVPLIQWALLILMLGGPRFAYRILKDRGIYEYRDMDNKRIPILIAGINEHTELFLRDVLRSSRSSYQVVGILDQGTSKIGRNIRNIDIVGSVKNIPEAIERLKRKKIRPSKVVIAPDIFSGTTLRELLNDIEQYGMTLARLPKLSELKEGTEEKSEIRPIAIEDLLGRPQIVLDHKSMRQLISGKKVLVTGAGGSIGSELCRQIVGYDPLSLVLIEHSEASLYHIDMELEGKVKKYSVLCDIRNSDRVKQVFNEHKPELVFHAAALKHVPLGESNIVEMASTNIMGTYNVVNIAIETAVEAFVMISTDKAVNPISVMGATKRAAERYIQSLSKLSKSNTNFIIVRFGNVLGSAGSVVPLFRKQIAEGRPITITHPEMVRFFMTIKEAVELVLEASVLGVENKESVSTMVLDMGEPVKILDLANQLVKLSGLKPDIDVPITYTGLRPGEKLYEELFYPYENSMVTRYEGVKQITMNHNEASFLTEDMLNSLKQAVGDGDPGRIMLIIKEMVPEYNIPLNNRSNT